MKARGSPRRYTIVLERTDKNFGAYVPDLPGCAAVAESKKEVLRLIREAVELHLQSLREDDTPIPEPTTTSDCIEVTL